MSKTDRLSLVREIATRPARILSKLDGFTPEQAKRVLRRTCPKLKLAA